MYSSLSLTYLVPDWEQSLVLHKKMSYQLPTFVALPLDFVICVASLSVFSSRNSLDVSV